MQMEVRDCAPAHCLCAGTQCIIELFGNRIFALHHAVMSGHHVLPTSRRLTSTCGANLKSEVYTKTRPTNDNRLAS